MDDDEGSGDENINEHERNEEGLRYRDFWTEVMA